nr:site-specific integrase [Micromonospora sp. DSM 115978]
APTTQRAYTSDLAAWLDYCVDHGVDPLRSAADDLARWAGELATLPRPATGRALAAASRARILAAVSSWYSYLQDVGLVVGNPVTVVRPVVARPVVDRNQLAAAPEHAVASEQGTAEPAKAEPAKAELVAAELVADRLFAAAAVDTGPAAARTRVLVWLLAQVGMPVRDVLAADVDGYDRPAGTGPGRLQVRARTGRTSVRELPAEVADLLDAYLADRAARTGTTRGELGGPLLTTATGARLDQPAVFRL